MPNAPDSADQDPAQLKFMDGLLDIMDGKTHPSLRFFQRETLEKATRDEFMKCCHQEFPFIRDFQMYLRRIIGQNPPGDVVRALEENLLEEEQGRISGYNLPHAELYLRTKDRMDFSRRGFHNAKLLPSSQRFKEWLDHITYPAMGWRESLAVLTIFCEGSSNERQEIAHGGAPVDIKSVLENHFLVRNYHLSPTDLILKDAHLKVEGAHRKDAWYLQLSHTRTDEQREGVNNAMKTSLNLWLEYREGIARACDVPLQYRLSP